MAFVNDEDVVGVVADMLQVDAAKLPRWWPALVRRQHQRAYSEILRTLCGKGFAVSQVNGWDEGDQFERDLTAYYSGVQGNALKAYNLDTKNLAAFDRREELKSIPVLIVSGAIVQPQGTVNQPQIGDLDTSKDTFIWPDPEDGNIGEVTHW